MNTPSTRQDTLGIDASPQELELMINEIDQDNSGEIDFEGTSACFLNLPSNSMSCSASVAVDRPNLEMAWPFRQDLSLLPGSCPHTVFLADSLSSTPPTPPQPTPTEFVSVMSRKVNASYTADQVRSAFSIFEGDAPPGLVRADALVKALTTYGTEKLSEPQAQELVSQLEIDGNGMINYVDYISMMMAGGSNGSAKEGSSS